MTIDCIKHLFDSKNACFRPFEMDVYLTDDGSVDGTSAAVKELFPTVYILHGNGNLFWAGGMRNSWKEALKKKRYDGFLLLNDDTLIENSCFNDIFITNEFSLNHYGKYGIYIGSVKNKKTQEFTYGGRLLLNKWTYKTKNIVPNGIINECHLGNANIMFVHYSLFESIGILSEKYVHAKADYDYTLRAMEKKFPILVCPNYCGYCTYDHSDLNLKKMNLKERLRYLKDPKGIELSGYMYFMWRFFPYRAPFVFCSLWLKTFFPGFSYIIDKIMNR
jgi:GT2 family glycosyltransferase